MEEILNETELANVTSQIYEIKDIYGVERPVKRLARAPQNKIGTMFEIEASHTLKRRGYQLIEIEPKIRGLDFDVKFNGGFPKSISGEYTTTRVTNDWQRNDDIIYKLGKGKQLVDIGEVSESWLIVNQSVSDSIKSDIFNQYHVRVKYIGEI